MEGNITSHICPSCGEYFITEPTEYDNLGKTLCAAICIIGERNIDDFRKLVSIMYDLAPGLSKEIRIFSRTVAEHNSSFLMSLYHADIDDLEKKRNILQRKLIDDEGLSQEWAEMLTSAIQSAVLMLKGEDAQESVIDESDPASLYSDDVDLEESDATETDIDGDDDDDDDDLDLDELSPEEVGEMIAECESLIAEIDDLLSEESDKPYPYSEMEKMGDHVPEKAFYRDEDVLELVIPPNIKSVGEEAFCMCKNIVSVQFPDKLTEIGRHGFNHCISLKKVILPEGLTSIEDYAFFCCEALKEVHIPSGVTVIKSSAFSGCDKLNCVHIPLSVTEFESFAFWDCESIKEVFYAGTKREWRKIKKRMGNEVFRKATIHFSCEGTGNSCEN